MGLVLSVLVALSAIRLDRPQSPGKHDQPPAISPRPCVVVSPARFAIFRSVVGGLR
ncbi:hypothetical protein [Krasilnikovia sp. M28-CT-15]|uniref:hypothetical protein n=1 Tax=Krasilnikovia sp. M28-CT-15 TaxID=3373540 RepID=UPI00387654E5